MSFYYIVVSRGNSISLHFYNLDAPIIIHTLYTHTHI